MDPREGWVMLELAFGPNMVSGTLDERGVYSYSVFLATVTGDRFFDIPALANVTTQADKADGDSCCDVDAYFARVTAELPENHSAVRLEVAPVTTPDGEALTAGVLTDYIVDWHDPKFVRSMGGARRSCALPLCPCIIASWTFLFNCFRIR